jgi:hypothetical protein
VRGYRTDVQNAVTDTESVDERRAGAGTRIEPASPRRVVPSLMDT